MLLGLNRQRMSDCSKTYLKFLLLKYPKLVGKIFPLGCYWDLCFKESFQTFLVSAKPITGEQHPPSRSLGTFPSVPYQEFEDTCENGGRRK